MSIKNYTLKKVKSIFVDGAAESIEFLFCGDKIEYIAKIEKNKVSLYQKNSITGVGKLIDIPVYKVAALEYFNNNEFEEVRDYIK